MPDDDLTPRERRAQRAKESGSGGHKPSGTFFTPTVIGWIIAILIIGGAIAGFSYTSWKQGQCPGHWHASFVVVIDGEPVPYTQYNLENQRTPFESHLHRGEGGTQIHFEPSPAKCIDFKDFLSAVDTTITSKKVVLTGHHGETEWAGTYDNQTVRAFRDLPDNDWEEVSVSSIMGRQLKDGEKVLFLYGDYTDAEVQQWQGQVPFPPATGTDPDHR